MRLALCFLLTFASAPAWAEWVKVSETDGAVFHIDSRTIQKHGHMRRVWEVQDLKQKHEDGYMSIRPLADYDCKARRRRIFRPTSRSICAPSATTCNRWAITRRSSRKR